MCKHTEYSERCVQVQLKHKRHVQPITASSYKASIPRGIKPVAASSRQTFMRQVWKMWFTCPVCRHYASASRRPNIQCQTHATWQCEGRASPSLSRRTTATLALFVPNGLLIIRSLACVAGWGSGDLTRALTLAQHMIYGRIDLRAGSRERRRLTFAEAGDGFVAVNGHE